ncbi:MAG: TetR/AcrR family transcriptional regulator [Planctomycetota bacterium]
MPKLSPAQIEVRKRRVEDAALVRFQTRGFHGTGLREIAEEAGVSLGAIYTYYPSKEALFDALLERLHAAFAAQDSPLADYFAQCRFPHDLEALGQAIGRTVEAHRDYLTLIYVDMVEFQGRHVRPYYQALRASFSAALGERARAALPGGQDPVTAFLTVYMQFFNFFIVERMIGARRHLGLSEGQALTAIAALFTHGLGEAP